MPNVRSIILKQNDFGEYDRMYSLLTEDNEKISAMAKGIKKPLAKLVSIIRPFTIINLNLVGKSHIRTIAGAELVEEFEVPLNNLQTLADGYYYLEIIDVVLEEGSLVPGIFELLTETLKTIPYASSELLRSFFEIKLLDTLGHRPQLERCVISGESFAENEPLFFSLKSGGVVKEKYAESEKAMRINATIVKLMRVSLENDLNDATKLTGYSKSDLAITREIISYLISHLLDRNLKTAVFQRKITELS